jgi:hypothetical protein
MAVSRTETAPRRRIDDEAPLLPETPSPRHHPSSIATSASASSVAPSGTAQLLSRPSHRHRHRLQRVGTGGTALTASLTPPWTQEKETTARSHGRRAASRLPADCSHHHNGGMACPPSSTCDMNSLTEAPSKGESYSALILSPPVNADQEPAL